VPIKDVEQSEGLGDKNMENIINGINVRDNDVTGQKFGMLTAIMPICRNGGRHKKSIIWLWKCDCGKETEKETADVKRGHSVSCGCWKKIKLHNMFSKGNGVSSFNTLYGSYKQKARERNLSFDLSKEYFRELTSQNCFYCGKEPLQIPKNNQVNGVYLHNGIDRINNSLGYSKENCVACCKQCNIAKRDYTIEKWYEWINRLHANLQEKGIWSQA
jgi:hypothetical protein